LLALFVATNVIDTRTSNQNSREPSVANHQRVLIRESRIDDIGCYQLERILICRLCLQRYQAVVRPLSHRSKLTNAKLKFIIPSCWLAGLLWNAPLFVAVTYREDLETCGEKWPDKLSPIAYSLGWAVVAGVIPISVMSYLYSRVVYKLWFDRMPVVKSTSAVSTVGTIVPSTISRSLIMSFVLNTKDQTPPGVYSTKLYAWRLRPEVQPLLYSILTVKVPIYIP